MLVNCSIKQQNMSSRANNITVDSYLPVFSLVELRPLPFDLVRDLENIFSAKEVARPIPPTFLGDLGERDGNAIRFDPVRPRLSLELRPNSRAWSGGVATAVESSDDISDEVDTLYLVDMSGPLDFDILPKRLKLENLPILGDLEGVVGVITVGIGTGGADVLLSGVC